MCMPLTQVRSASAAHAVHEPPIDTSVNTALASTGSHGHDRRCRSDVPTGGAEGSSAADEVSIEASAMQLGEANRSLRRSPRCEHTRVWLCICTWGGLDRWALCEVAAAEVQVGKCSGQLALKEAALMADTPTSH